jgi:hypothetical protein
MDAVTPIQMEIKDKRSFTTGNLLSGCLVENPGRPLRWQLSGPIRQTCQTGRGNIIPCMEFLETAAESHFLRAFPLHFYKPVNTDATAETKLSDAASFDPVIGLERFVAISCEVLSNVWKSRNCRKDRETSSKPAISYRSAVTRCSQNLTPRRLPHLVQRGISGHIRQFGVGGAVNRCSSGGSVRSTIQSTPIRSSRTPAFGLRRLHT